MRSYTICVDTSVWIEFFRDSDSQVTSELVELLDDNSVILAGPVWIELVSGAPKKELERLSKVLSAIPRCYPQKSTWKTIEVWAKQSSFKGHRFGMGDLLIAGIAAENHAKVWSLDSDFSRMKQLKFIDLY